MTLFQRVTKTAGTALKSFGATLVSMGITWLAGEALSLVVTEINNLVHAAENAREKSTELTKAWQEDNSSIDDSITKYKELHSKLSDASLSTEEVEQAKESLVSVQKDLIDKYGEEVKGIDLVNGKYSKQLGLLDQLSKKKAGDYVAENYKDIQADQKYLSEKINLNKSLGFKGSQARPDDYSNAGFDLKKYLDRYNKLSAKVVNPDGQYGMTGDVNLVTNGTRQEVYNQLSKLSGDLSDDFGNSNKDVNRFRTTISGILKDSFDKNKINDAKNNVKKYAQAQILSNDNTRKLYSEATDAVEKYTNALSSGKNIKEAKENLDNVKNKVKDINKTVSGGKAVFDDLFNTIDTDSENTQKKVETVAEKVSFKQAWKDLGSTDDDALKDTQKNLLELAQAGKLTRDSFKNTSGATTWLQSLGLDVDEVIQKIYNLKDVDETQLLSSLKSGIKLIQDAFADKRDNGVAGADTLNSMESEFGNLSSWKNYKRVLGSTTSDLDACRKAQNELASEYINSNNFLSKLVKGTGEVDEKTKQYYTSQLKELGIKNAKDVVDQQIVNRQKEIAQAKSQEIIDIKTSSIDLQNATQDEIQSLIDETEQLEGNTNALKLYLLQKMMSKDDAFDTEESVNNLINLANECNASETVINNLKNALKNLQDNGNIQLSIGLDFSANNPLTGTSIGNSLIGNNLPTFPTLQESVINDVANDQQNLNDEFQKNKDNALSENEKRLRKQNKKLQAKIDALLKDAASSNSKSNGSSSSKSNTSKEFNWIDVLIKRTERKVQKSIDRITDYASKKTKNNLFGKALKAYGKEEKTYANASDFYLKKFNKVKISKNAKKDAEWKRKIKNGKLDIQTITNEKLADKISKAQDYYDNYLDYQDKQTGAKQNALALRKQKLDDDIAYIEAKSDRIQRLSDSVQNRIDNNDALGLATSENSYKELIKYSKKQVKRWIDEKATYAEYLSTLKRGSTEYIETEQKIADCDSKIQDAKKSQLEWNQTIAQMPLDKFERLGNVISSIITNLGNFNSLLESQGKKMTSSQILSEISVRNQSIANNDQDIAYNEGERFTNAIRSVINAKYDGVYGTKIVNKEADPIANNLRPLFEKLLSNEISLDDFYSKASEQTHMTVDALKQNKELSDILTSVSKLESENYSLMQEQEEYTDKLVDIEISKYQELRDEIEKVNDAKQKAIELTKKEIALQKELENRTNLIYRNGQYGYESDSSAVREKQNDLDNYYAQQQLDKLDDIIDKLGDLKNTLNYREGTEPIGDYKTNPSHLVEAAKRLIIGITGEVKGAYASGTTSAKGGLSLTGENGTELRVLNRGDGIIPAEITKNLMEFGVDPAKMIMDNLNKNIPDYKNIITPVNTSTDNSIHIDKVEMSGVNDVQSFMKELSHLTLDAQQRAYKR